MIIAIVASVMIGAFFGAALMACLSMSRTEKEPEIDTEFASPYDNGHNIQRYPITEISTPHGRLIDADELLKAFEKACEQDGHWVNFFALVESAPTIIEAEVSK